jgi:hypothetical protein
MLSMLSSDSGLVPAGIDNDGLAPFLDHTLYTLVRLGFDEGVQQYLSVEPDAHRAIRELSAAVAAAGARVRDTSKHHRVLDDHMYEFTADEFWMFDLAIDVVAMIGTLGGLSPDRHASAVSTLRSLDEHANTHHWKHQVKKAGSGPAQFRELRAHVPHRKPRPT